MSGGGSSKSTTYTKADPWSGLQPYIKDLLPGFSEAAMNVPSFYPEQTYADFDPLQEYGMGGMVDYSLSPMLNQSIGNQFGAMNYGLNSVYNPEANPVLSRYVDSATRPLTQAYEEAIGNTIAGGAAGAGGLGGSRQGVAEGLATRSYLDAMQDTATDIYQDAYGKGLDQQARMAALAPQTMQAAMLPYNIQDTVGGRYQGMNQQAIDEAMSRYDYDQNAAYDRYSDYFMKLMGTPYGTRSTTGPNPNEGNTMANLLGGGMLGAGAGSMFGVTAPAGATGMAAMAPFAPWMLGGAVLGGLLS